MKTLKPFFIFVILSICFTQVTTEDRCQARYNETLQEKCADINHCRLNLPTYECFEVNPCSVGDNNKNTCNMLSHPEFHTKECKYNDETNLCDEIPKACSRFRFITYNYQYISEGDVCSDLVPGEDTNGKCKLIENQCKIHYDTCSECPDSTICNYNVPLDQTIKCEWDSDSNQCKDRGNKRKCSEFGRDMNKEICPNLDVSDTSNPPVKACVDNELSFFCDEVYISCASYSSSDCNGKIPLLSDKSAYDYSQICYWDADSGECKSRTRKCSETSRVPYFLLEEKCTGYDASDEYKRCAYRSGQCYDEYKSCQAYNDNTVEKTRSGCESIQLLDTSKKCVYIPEDDICKESINYNKCQDYTGDDRKICESIISPTTHSYCVLEKDSKCRDRIPYCSEVTDVNDCIYYAKATNSNKKCAYGIPTPSSSCPTSIETTGDSQCYEEYASCEDYKGDCSTICESIKLYNGLTCEFKSGKCTSTYKTCEEALTKEECKLISKSGAIDSDKKVCYWTNDGDCIETYKYCSDYRTVLTSGQTGYDDAKSFCENNIKPYDESGNNLDFYSKCEYESGVGCQRVPKDCEDSDVINNPVLCNLISPKIKDNDIKHCAYYSNNCKKNFKKCEDVINKDDCSGNIIEGYIVNECLWDNNKCVKKNKCNGFSYNYYGSLCQSISPNCVISPYDYRYCTEKEQDCVSTKFYTDEESNERTCKSKEASVPYKVCALKEDKSGCEEIYRESIYSTPGTISKENQENSSSSLFMMKGVVIILGLLF